MAASREVPFTDLLSKIIDNRGRTCPVVESGLPLIATNCIRNDRLYPAFENVRYVSDEVYETWFRGHPEPGDIVFVCKGTPGRVCLTPDPVNFCIAQDMVAVRADPSKVYPRYLFALLRSPGVQNKIANMHVGTLIPHFKKGDFDKLLLPVPEYGIQKMLGDMYFEMSALIDCHRRMNETLEATARTLFKSWFVDFDPVRAKSEGRLPAGMDVATAALFPERFDDGDAGVPQGWHRGNMDLIAESPRRVVQPSEIDPDTAYIGLEHMPRRSIALGEWGKAHDVTSGKSRFARGDILFGKLRPYFHKVGIAPLDGVCSTDILVITPRRSEFFWIVLCHASSDAMIQHTNACSSGTKMPRASWGDIARFEIPIPPVAVAGAFAEIIRPLADQILSNIHEARRLAEIRDRLFPRLLSKVDERDRNKEVAAVF